MNLQKELSDVQGYSIIKIENMDLFNKLRDSFIEMLNIPNETKKNINTVREEIAKMSKVQINRSMVELLKYTDISEMIIKSFPNLIKKLCTKELFIQRRATIIMNVPGNGQAKQWPHYELMSGISPFTYVIWAPLHDLEDRSGVYYIDQKKSLEIMKEEEEKGLVNGPTVLNMMNQGNPLSLKFGEAVIFNPFVLHGNIEFKSKLARIAYTVRFQSYNKPLLQKNSDYLKYYKLN
tara:strand:- start:127 stop:831 length:705 start_codon:yes stop_codon:yes gene_type:complete